MGVNELFYEIDSFLSYNSKYAILVALFLMFFILVFISLRKVLFVNNSEKGIAGIIALVVSLIATAYLSEKQISIITGSYNQLGFFVWFFIPFFFIVLFVHSLNLTTNIRRGIILFFSAMFYYLLPSKDIFSDNFSLVAIGILVLAVIFDKQVNKFVKSFKSNIEVSRK